jgi:hypothetical protein
MAKSTSAGHSTKRKSSKSTAKLKRWVWCVPCKELHPPGRARKHREAFLRPQLPEEPIPPFAHLTRVDLSLSPRPSRAVSSLPGTPPPLPSAAQPQIESGFFPDGMDIDTTDDWEDLDVGLDRAEEALSDRQAAGSPILPIDVKSDTSALLDRVRPSRSAWVEDYESDNEEEGESAAAIIDQNENLLDPNMWDYDTFDYDSFTYNNDCEIVDQLGVGFEREVAEAGT